MESFEAIRAYLAAVRRRLRRRDGLRALFYLLAGLAGLALAGPIVAIVVPTATVPFLRTLLLVLSGAGVLAFLVAGIVLPRLSLRRDPEVARHVGVAAPKLASDVLSAVELEPELALAPRFSRDLALALAADIAIRLDMVDPARVAPAKTVQRSALWLAGLGVATAAIWLVFPGTMRAGWMRLLAYDASEAAENAATPVSEPLVLETPPRPHNTDHS